MTAAFDAIEIQPAELNLLEKAFRQACRTLDVADSDVAYGDEPRHRLAQLIIDRIKQGERSVDVLAVSALEDLGL